VARRAKRALNNPVTISFDGDSLLAEAGEPLATTLIAAGHLALARSPKFHRPRGPSCMRAACDGCLARVDGVPNVMTCLTPAAEGTTIESQNRLGPRDLDLLRMTDWFFPDGMNHHELFAGVPGVQRVMQIFARRVAGLGKIPTASLAPRPARRVDEDVLVIGAGASGMAVANAFVARGRKVRIVDDALEWGGATRALARAAFESIASPFSALVAEGNLRFEARTTICGLYGDDALLVGPEGAEVVNAKTLVLAVGAHDGVLAFDGNDVPGVMSARAGGFLAQRSVAPGRRVVICRAPGSDGVFSEGFARAVRERALDCEVTVLEGEPVEARGTSRVKEVAVREGSTVRALAADAFLIDAPRAPAYELAEQAGARIAFGDGAFRVEAPRGRISDRILVAGELAGTAFDAKAITRAANALAG
jgi:sarcosine oxidase, subunit alpha